MMSLSAWEKQFLAILTAICLGLGTAGQVGAADAASIAVPADEALWPWVKDLDQPPSPPAGVAGRWLPWDNQYKRLASQFSHGGITKAQGEAWDRQMLAIGAFLKQAPLLQQPAGFYPHMYGFITVVKAGSWNDRPKQAPLAGGVSALHWPPRDIQVGAGGEPRLKPGSEILEAFTLELNFVYPPAGFDWMKDGQGEFGPLRKQGEYGGFPIYDNALHLTRDGRLPYRPVSQERVLRAFLARFKDEPKNVEQRIAAARKSYEAYMAPARVAERKAKIDEEVDRLRATARQPSEADQRRHSLEARQKSNEEGMRLAANPDLERDPKYATLRAVRAAEAQLASMSEAEHRRPAWQGRNAASNEAGLVPEGTPGSSPLISFDPDFFDAGAPRHEIRIALVRKLHTTAYNAHRRAPTEVNVAARANLLLLQQTDWRQFAEKFVR